MKRPRIAAPWSVVDVRGAHASYCIHRRDERRTFEHHPLDCVPYRQRLQPPTHLGYPSFSASLDLSISQTSGLSSCSKTTVNVTHPTTSQLNVSGSGPRKASGSGE
ncbi:hypothetical protein AB1N83_012105 [Pleurotus pulmonarius]